MNNALKQSLAAGALLSVAAIWGSTFILVKWAVEELDVYYFLFLRFLIASLFMLLVFNRKLFGVRKETLKAALVLSIFLSGSYVAQTEGLRFTTATNVAMITGLYLILIPLFLFIFFKFRANVASLVGAVVSVAGLYLLTKYSFQGINLGDYLALACAVGYAWHAICTERFTSKFEVIQLVFYQFVFITLYYFIIVMAKGSYVFEISGQAWFALGITSIFATVLAILVLTWSLRFIEATRAGIIFAMESVFGALFAWWLGGEVLTIIAFIGACLMVSGMVVSESKPFAKYILDKIFGP